MFKKSLLLMLLMAVFAPWATAQTRDVATVDFETGSLSALNAIGIVTNDATYPWAVTDATNHTDGGTYSIKSGNEGQNSKTSSFTMEVNFNQAGTLSFYAKISSESGWDKGYFSIDGSAQSNLNGISGNGDWISYSYNVEAGTHTFRWYYTKDSSGASNDDRFYVDDITFSGFYVPSCLKPNGLAASNVTDATATLSWTETGTATNWVLQYGTDNEFATYTEANVTGTPSVNLSSLTSQTTYYARVKSDCGGGDASEWTNTVSFRTTAVATAVGDSWSDDFEGTSCGWDLVNGELTNKWAWGTAASNGGTHGLYVSNDNGTSNAYANGSSTMVYATKLLSFTEGKYEFAYNWMANGENNWDFLRVVLVPSSVTLTAGTTLPTGLGSSGTPTGWIAVDGGSQLQGVTAWQSKSVAVNVTAGAYYLVLAWRNDSSGGTQPPAAVDNVSVTKMACPYDVADLAASNITTNSATLTWTAGEATGWEVMWANNSGFEGASTETVSAATINLSGLTASTTYYAKARAYCGGSDYGAWCNAISFPTECDVIPALGYAENFDTYTAGTGVLPLCWDKINTTTTASYQGYPRIYANGYTTYAHSAPNCLYFYSYYSSSYDPQDQYAILPEMTGLAGMQITLQAKGSNANSTFFIGVMEDPKDEATFEAIAPQQALTTAYQEFIYNVPSGAKGNYVAIMIEAATSSRTSNGVYIDDITITTPPSCLKPTDLAVNYGSGTTATVSWTSEATAWNIDVNGTVTAITENPYTLTGLDFSTTYEVKVQANCGSDGTSEWTAPVSFTTSCAPIDLPYTYGFEDASELNCWDVIATSSSTGIATASDAPEGGAVFRFYYTEHDAYLVSPVFNGTELGLGVSFQYMNSASSTSYTEQFKVGYTTDANAAPADFIYGDIIEGENEWVMYENSFPANTKRIAIKYIYTDAMYLRLDDFTFEVPNNCRKPSDFAVSEIGPHSVVLSWTENGEATEWLIEYIGENDTVVSSVTATTNPYTLTGLDAETQYIAQVTPVCVADKPSDAIYWTTLEACPKPDVTVTTTPVSADVEWTGWGEGYELEWAEAVAATSSAWLRYDDGTLASNVGNAGGGQWTWGVMYPTDSLKDNVLTKIAFYEVDDSYYTYGTINLKVYSGGDTIPETLIGSETITTDGTVGMREVVLTTPIEFDPAQNLWITLTTNATYCLAMSAQNGGANSRWFFNGSDWVDFGTLFATGATYSFMIRGFAESIDYSKWNWTSETGVTSPFTISGLEPETDYVVKVKSSCGSDGESGWAWSYFTTPSNCDAPFDLVAEPLDESATLSWTGYQDQYNVKYRTAASYTPIWEEDFENGLDQWTILHGDAATCPAAGYWYTIDPTSGLGFDAHSGTYCASSWSWNSSAYQADNYLVTPQLNLEGVLKFWVRTNPSYPDSYEVLLSTGGNTIDDFTVTLQAMAAAPDNGEWNEVIIDLTAYAGQNCYIAIHHEDYDANYLVIDDFGLYTPVAAGAWTSLTNQANPVVVTTEPGKTYEWQVQGIHDKCDAGGTGLTDWSSIDSFTTYDKVYDDEEWVAGETTIEDEILLIHDVIIPDGVVAYANSITLESGAQLIIEDGGQLICNEPVVATVIKDIAASAKSGSDVWYTISSPVNNVKSADVTNLISSTTSGFTYDLYLYDEPTHYWLNQKDATNGSSMFTHLTNGRGYLYWNNGADLEFTGELNVDDVTYSLTYTNAADELKGFNLIGNPFSHNIYKGVGAAIDSDKLADGYFTLSNEAAWHANIFSTPIAPTQGILVQATEAFNLTIANVTTAATAEKRSSDFIEIVVANDQYYDVAYAVFNKGIGLNKIDHMNADIPEIYFEQNHERYAIATSDNDEEEMALNFKAATSGTYDIKVRFDGQFGYLHLIDNMTGNDVDLLETPSYTFDAQTTDYASRFRLVFATGTNDDSFAFISNGEIILNGVNGNTTVQVFDVTGRMINSTNGANRIATNNMAAGVYMLRLINGDNVKTQKIVVK